MHTATHAGLVEQQAIIRGLTAPDGTGYFLPPYVDGSPGGQTDEHKSHLRLCFAGPTVEMLKEAGRRLGEACEAAAEMFLEEQAAAVEVENEATGAKL